VSCHVMRLVFVGGSVFMLCATDFGEGLETYGVEGSALIVSQFPVDTWDRTNVTSPPSRNLSGLHGDLTFTTYHYCS
jgi:hypothetical protein